MSQAQPYELPDIIYLGMNPWDTIRQRSQHLATGLSRHARVLFGSDHAFRGWRIRAGAARRSPASLVFSLTAARRGLHLLSPRWRTLWLGSASLQRR